MTAPGETRRTPGASGRRPYQGKRRQAGANRATSARSYGLFAEAPLAPSEAFASPVTAPPTPERRRTGRQSPVIGVQSERRSTAQGPRRRQQPRRAIAHSGRCTWHAGARGRGIDRRRATPSSRRATPISRGRGCSGASVRPEGSPARWERRSNGRRAGSVHLVLLLRALRAHAPRRGPKAAPRGVRRCTCPFQSVHLERRDAPPAHRPGGRPGERRRPRRSGAVWTSDCRRGGSSGPRPWRRPPRAGRAGRRRPRGRFPP